MIPDSRLLTLPTFSPTAQAGLPLPLSTKLGWKKQKGATIGDSSKKRKSSHSHFKGLSKSLPCNSSVFSNHPQSFKSQWFPFSTSLCSSASLSAPSPAKNRRQQDHGACYPHNTHQGLSLPPACLQPASTVITHYTLQVVSRAVQPLPEGSPGSKKIKGFVTDLKMTSLKKTHPSIFL